MLARNNYHEWKSRHDAADVEERRKAFLFEFHSFQKGKRRGLDLAGFQSLGSRRTVADTVKNFVIAVAHQAFLSQAFDRGEFRHAAWTRDADDFAFQIVDTADPLGAEQSVVHIRLNAADDEHRRVLRDCANRRYPGYQGIIHAAAHQRGHGRGAAADENGFHFQTFGSKEAEFLRDHKRQGAAQGRRVGSKVDGLGFDA